MTDIRKAIATDAAEVHALRKLAILSQCVGAYDAELLRLWTDGELSERFSQAVQDSFYVIASNDKIVASGAVDLVSGQVDAIFVHPAHFRQGLGKRIMGFLEQHALDHGLTKLKLDATLNAADFYRSCGFSGDTVSIYHSPRGIELACVPMLKVLQPK